MKDITQNKIEESLSNSLQKAKELFLQENLYKKILIPNVDCSQLSEPKDTNGKKLPEHIETNIFKPLHQFDRDEVKINSCPCLYVFELHDIKDRDRVLKAFTSEEEDKINRKLPALKSPPPISKYLYVGKVEKEVGGRLVTHLGYYQSSGNHGLQLAFWAKELRPPLMLNIHVYRFTSDMKPYIQSFEKMLAKELNPIIGKH